MKVVKDLLLFNKVTALSNSQIGPYCPVEKALDKNHRNRLQVFHYFLETHISYPCGISVLCLRLGGGLYVNQLLL